MIWEKIKTTLWLKWSLITVAVFVILLASAFSANAYINNRYTDRIIPNVYLGSLNLAGLNYEQAREVLAQKIDFINQRGYVYQSELKTVVVYPNAFSVDSPDTYQPLIIWDIDKSLDQIMVWQQQKSIRYLPSKLEALWFNKHFPIAYQWDEQQYLTILENNLTGLLTPKQDADFVWEGQKIKIIPENSGQTFDYQQAMEQTAQQISYLTNQDIPLAIISQTPAIFTKDIAGLENNIIATANRGHFYLTYDQQDWGVPSEVWRQWLQVKKDQNRAYVGFDGEALNEYLTAEGILDQVNRPVKDAKFNIVDGKVEEFIGAQSGQAVDIEKTIQSMEQTIANSGELEIALAVETVEPKITNDDVNDLGITEIIGTGESDFTGSPVNRVHNIKVGAEALDGILIAPDEEFSLLKALGPIDGEHGYLQELVIKGNETKPEYGGGLCQIGTTTFRATIASGLPVTERRNHSYRVRYYEPAGTDATIYDPAPDYKFKNDTGHYLLIKTRIEDTKLYFDFWGTKDGREVTITEPTIYNIVPPPPEKIIKTTDLEPGKQKCTESAHHGADAKFDYTVKYSGQTEPVLVTFRSHYVPWQKVCLLGVTEEELLAETASSTPGAINTSTPPVVE